VAGKKKQYLNSKKHKKEEKWAQKSDTPEALPRPSAQDSTRTRRKRRRRTVQSSWHNTPDHVKRDFWPCSCSQKIMDYTDGRQISQEFLELSRN
ncbi:unnamed protein product, partial [Porites lobata]